MLEKDKNCIEFSMHSMMVTHNKPYQDDIEIAITGMAPGKSLLCAKNPFDIPCDVVVVSKSYFEALQTENEQLRTENEKLKKKLEEFSPVPKYSDFLKALYPEATEATIEKLVWTTEQLCCGRDLRHTLQVDLEYYRALSSSQAKSVYNWKEATGCSTPEEAKELIDGKKRRIIELKDELDASLSANEELKKKLQVPDPFADYKELLEKLHSKEDVEKFEWTLNHICGGQASANGWMVTAKLWRRNYETLSKLVGFSSTEEIQDYLTNEAECDTLQEAVSKLKDQVKYTCDEWYSANSRNNSWKAAAECNSPKELIEKREALEEKVKVLETEAEVYSRTLQEWKEGTGYPNPSSVKAALDSGAAWCHAYGDVKEQNKKLADVIKSWQNVTGYSTPEDYMHARISGAFRTPFDYTAAWQKATGCDSPCDAEKRIKALNERIDESEACYNHLLALTGFGSEGEIEDALDQCDHSTLRKALVDYEFDYEELLKLTGYKSNQDIRVALNHSEQFVYESMRELINSLKRQAKFTKLNWQKATGCTTPDDAETTIRNLRGRIDEMKEFAAIASNWTDRIVED